MNFQPYSVSYLIKTRAKTKQNKKNRALTGNEQDSENWDGETADLNRPEEFVCFFRAVLAAFGSSRLGAESELAAGLCYSLSNGGI